MTERSTVAEHRFRTAYALEDLLNARGRPEAETTRVLRSRPD